jgi:hypothetical protein
MAGNDMDILLWVIPEYWFPTWDKKLPSMGTVFLIGLIIF